MNINEANMNIIESNWKLMSLIQFHCDKRARKQFNCVSQKWKDAGEFASFKNEILSKIELISWVFDLTLSIDLSECESYSGLKSCATQCYNYLKKVLPDDQKKHADIPLVWSKAFPKKFDGENSVNKVMTLPTNPIVTFFVDMINNQQYVLALEHIEPLLESTTDNICDALKAIIESVGENHALCFLTTANLGLTYYNFTDTAIFRIIKKGNPTGYNFFYPFLTSSNQQIESRANLLLDKIANKIKRMKAGTERNDLIIPYIKILNTLHKSDLSNDLSKHLLQPNNPSTENPELYNDRLRNALKLMRSGPAMEIPDMPSQEPNSNDQGSPFQWTVQPMPYPQIHSYTNPFRAAESVSPEDEVTLDIAVSLLSYDPLESFNYLLKNGGISSTNANYLKNVFETLKNAAQRIEDVPQKRIVFPQLLEWVKQFQYRPYYADWMQEVEKLIGATSGHENTAMIKDEINSRNISTGESRADASLPITPVLVPNTLNSMALTPASTSASSSSSSASSSSSSASSYPNATESFDLLTKQIFSSPQEANDQIKQLYEKMMAQGQLVEGLRIIDMNISNPHLKDEIFAKLIEWLMNGEHRNLNNFNQICEHITDAALIYELGHKFGVL